MTLTNQDKTTIRTFFRNLGLVNRYLSTQCRLFTQRRRAIINNYVDARIYSTIMAYDSPAIPADATVDNSTFLLDIDYHQPLNDLEEEFYGVYYAQVSPLSASAQNVFNLINANAHMDRYTIEFFNTIISPITQEDALSSFRATKHLEVTSYSVNEIGHFWQYLSNSLRSNTGDENLKMTTLLNL